MKSAARGYGGIANIVALCFASAIGIGIGAGIGALLGWLA